MEQLNNLIHEYLTPWDCFGLAGQSLFMLRFLYQWVASEKAKQVVVPEMFWYLSAVGGVMVLLYAIHLHKIVFILSQMALPIYIRNIYLIWRNKLSSHANVS